MKKVIAYKCDFCGKLLNSYSGMSKHEKICFYNTKSKSCITCKNLDFIPMFNGRKLTPDEVEILQFKKEDTYTFQYDADGLKYPVLKEQYMYLYDAEVESFCHADCKKLFKLKTQCDLWEAK